MYSARSGYEIVNQIGVPAIREKSVRQTTRLIELADDAGFAVNTCRNPEQRGGVVVLDVPDGQEVTRELARRQILVDYRPQAGIRVAPHFYTTDEELEHTVSEIRSIVSARSERMKKVVLHGIALTPAVVRAGQDHAAGQGKDLGGDRRQTVHRFLYRSRDRQTLSASAAHGGRQDRDARLPDGHRYPRRSPRSSAPPRPVVHPRRRQRLRFLGQRTGSEGRQQGQGQGRAGESGQVRHRQEVGDGVGHASRGRSRAGKRCSSRTAR